MEYLISQTSVDDMRSSLKLMNPRTRFEIREDLDYLKRSLSDEVKNRNRSSAIKLLQATMKRIRKANGCIR